MSTAGDFALDETRIAGAVLAERAKLFTDRMVASAISSPLGTLLLAWVEAPVSGWKRAATWLCMITLIELFIIGIGYVSRRARSAGKDTLPWARWMTFAALLLGLAWGSTVWLFWVEGQYLHYLLCLTVLVAVVGVDVVVMTPFRLAIALFAGGTLLPPMVHLALVPNPFAAQIAAGLTILSA